MSRSSVRNELPASVLRDIGMQAEPHALSRPLKSGRPSPLAGSESDSLQSPKPVDESNRQNRAPIPFRQDDHDAGERRGYEAGLAKGYQEGLQQGYAAGQQAGFEQGVEKGRQQGALEGRAAAEQAVQDQARMHQDAMGARGARLDQLLSLLPSAIAERIEAAEDDMVALCHMVICRFLGQNVVTRAVIAPMVQQAVRECCGESGKHGALQGLLAVQLHPQDLEIVKNDSVLLDWLSQHGAQTIQWLANEQVGLGGCIVRSTEGTLDARLEIQLAALHETLLQGRGQTAHVQQISDAL